MILNNNLPLNLWKVLAKFGGVSLSITDALFDDSGKSPGGERSTGGTEWRNVGRVRSPRAVSTPPRSSLMLCASVERAGAFELAVGGSWKAMCA